MQWRKDEFLPGSLEYSNSSEAAGMRIYVNKTEQQYIFHKIKMSQGLFWLPGTDDLKEK